MCTFFTTFVLLTVLLTALTALLYAFLVWNFDYWKKRGIKSAKSYPFLGSFPSQFTQKRNVIYDLDDYYNKYKTTENFVGVINCRLPQILILDPEYAHKIFVNDFRSFHDNEISKLINKKVDVILANNPFILTGEEWKTKRAEVTPVFTNNRINAIYPVTQEICKRFVEFIRKQQNGVNAKDISLLYTTEVVSDCLLGISAQNFSDNPSPIAEMSAKIFNKSTSFVLYTNLANLLPQIRKIFAVGLFNKKTEKFFYELTALSMNLRRKTQNKERMDFLNYMLQLQDKRGLHTDELASRTMTFLTDGFEATANVLAHTLLLLARYPETLALLREEIGSAPIGFEELNKLPYLEACMHETLRIFPVLLAGRKICTTPYELVNKDGARVQLQPGDVVIVPSWSLQHDPEYFPQPELFKPERFLESGSDAGEGLRKYREMGVYLGFGDGPRICPGMRFALTRIKAAVVEIVRTFNIKVNPKTRSDNYVDDTYFMAALHGGIWLDFEDRN